MTEEQIQVAFQQQIHVKYYKHCECGILLSSKNKSGMCHNCRCKNYNKTRYAEDEEYREHIKAQNRFYYRFWKEFNKLEW